MVTADGCLYKRIVVKALAKRFLIVSRLVTPATGTSNPLVLQKRKVSAVAIVEPKLATIITMAAISKDVPFAAGSF